MRHNSQCCGMPLITLTQASRLSRRVTVMLVVLLVFGLAEGSNWAAAQRIQWLELGPSQDSGNKGAGQRIFFTPDQRRILFSNATITFDHALLWDLDAGGFIEYSGWPARNIQQSRQKPFAKPPHPNRKAVFSIPDNLAKFNQRSNLNAVLNNGFSLSTQGRNGTTLYYQVDFNLRPLAGRALSVPAGSVVAHSWSRIIQSHRDGNVGRGPITHYDAIELRTLTTRRIASLGNDLPVKVAVGQQRAVAALQFLQGTRFYTLGDGNKAAVTQFAFPAEERTKIDFAAFVLGDQYLLMVTRDEELNGKAFWLLDVARAEVIQRLPVPTGQFQQAMVAESGTRLWYRGHNRSFSIFDISPDGLQLLADETTDEDLAELSLGVAWSFAADGNRIAFLRDYTDKTPDRAGVLTIAH